MSAPIKPWESSSLNSSAGPIIPNFDNVSGIRPSVIQSTTPALPPSLNPRLVANIRTTPQPITQSYPSYGGGYSMPYNSYGGGGGYGGYSGYNSYTSGYGSFGGYGNSYGTYGGYGSPYGTGYGYGMQQPGVENRFIQLAEESARPTFQTIESVVRTFSSMGAMLDQTFFAMTSSFRAILSVADSFGRLRAMMGQMWTSFALFKAINWLLRKLMSILRLYDSNQESVMNDAFLHAVTGGEAIIEAATPSRWPIAVFLGIIISAPYIVSKLFAQNLNDAAVDEEASLQFRNVPATYSFTAKNSHELSFQAGEMLKIYPDEIQQRNGLIRTGWVLAKNKQGVKGVIPINYLFENKTSS